MGKKELIAALLEKGVGESKASLEKKTVAVLTEMLKSLEKEADEKTPEDTTDGTLDVADEVEDFDQLELTEDEIQEGLEETEEVLGKSEFEVVSELKHQLGIFTEFIYNVRYEGAVVMVENIGVGDVYADVKAVRVGDKDKRILLGDSEVFEGASTLHLIAASQPEVKITELK